MKFFLRKIESRDIDMLANYVHAKIPSLYLSMRN